MDVRKTCTVHSTKVQTLSSEIMQLSQIMHALEPCLLCNNLYAETSKEYTAWPSQRLEKLAVYITLVFQVAFSALLQDVYDTGQSTEGGY